MRSSTRTALLCVASSAFSLIIAASFGAGRQHSTENQPVSVQAQLADATFRHQQAVWEVGFWGKELAVNMNELEELSLQSKGEPNRAVAARMNLKEQLMMRAGEALQDAQRAETLALAEENNLRQLLNPPKSVAEQK